VGCLVVLASGKRRLDAQLRETLIARIEQRLQEINGYLNKGKYKQKKYTQSQLDKALSKYPAIKGMLRADLYDNNGTLRLTWSRNSDVIDKAAIADGKYAILFSNPNRSTLDVFRRFKSRDRVEKRIDDIKGAGPVVVRPIYLHKDERIRGLILGCMIALLVVSIVEMLVKRNLRKRLTAEAMQEVFRNFSAALHTFRDRTQLVVMPVGNKWQRQILGAVGISMPAIVPVVVACATSNLLRNPAILPPPWEDIPPSDTPDG
jgi:transposase